MIRILNGKGDEVVETLSKETVMEMLANGYYFYESLSGNKLGDNVEDLDLNKNYLAMFPMCGG